MECSSFVLLTTRLCMNPSNQWTLKTHKLKPCLSSYRLMLIEAEPPLQREAFKNG